MIYYISFLLLYHRFKIIISLYNIYDMDFIYVARPASLAILLNKLDELRSNDSGESYSTMRPLSKTMILNIIYLISINNLKIVYYNFKTYLSESRIVLSL